MRGKEGVDIGYLYSTRSRERAAARLNTGSQSGVPVDSYRHRHAHRKAPRECVDQNPQEFRTFIMRSSVLKASGGHDGHAHLSGARAQS